MRTLEPVAKAGALIGAFAVASFLAYTLHGGGLWDGLTPAIAANSVAVDHTPARTT